MKQRTYLLEISVLFKFLLFVTSLIDLVGIYNIKLRQFSLTNVKFIYFSALEKLLMYLKREICFIEIIPKTKDDIKPEKDDIKPPKDDVKHHKLNYWNRFEIMY